MFVADIEVQTDFMDLQNEIQDIIILSSDRMDVQYLLHHPSEIDVSAERNEQDLVTYIHTSEDTNVNQEYNAQTLLLCQEQHRILVSPQFVLAQFYFPSESLSGIRRAPFELGANKQNDLWQSKITLYLQ